LEGGYAERNEKEKEGEATPRIPLRRLVGRRRNPTLSQRSPIRRKKKGKEKKKRGGKRGRAHSGFTCIRRCFPGRTTPYVKKGKGKKGKEEGGRERRDRHPVSISTLLFPSFKKSRGA